MKLLLTTFLLVIAAINTNVSKALNEGDSKKLAGYFYEKVELSILEEEENYSRIQAEQVIKKFFSKYPVVNYETVHMGNAKDGSAFEIGSLVTKSATFRTYFLLKGNGKAQKIHQFRIEESEE